MFVLAGKSGPATRLGILMTTTAAPTTTDVPATPATDLFANIVANRESIIAAYGTADKSGKAKIRTAVNEALMNAVRNLDMNTAKCAQELIESLKSVSTKNAESADPNAVLAARIIALRMAADCLAYGVTVPDGMDSAEIDYMRVSELLDEVDARAYSDAEWDSAEKLAKSKITRRSTSGGDRRDIGDWLIRAADNMRTGQVATMSQLVQLGIDPDSDDTYRPSSGAIAARLYPTKGDVTLDLHEIGFILVTNSAGNKSVEKI